MTTRFNDQDAPIYSDDPREEELMIEFNSRFDYQRELAAEHYDQWADADDYEDEAPSLRGSGWWSCHVCECRALTICPF